MLNEIALPSFAKINLNLRVLGMRPDGYHELFTVYQTVSLRDELVIRESRDISVICDHPDVPSGESNIVHKALVTLRDKYRIERGASVTIRKKIPSPGGLGGGSSNAAVALLAASRLWSLDLNRGQLVKIGAELGSDVPLFFYGGTAIGTGRGTLVEQVKDVDLPFLLIASPDVNIPTGQAFRKLGSEDLTKNRSKSILKHYRDGVEALYSGRFEFENDFQKVIFEQFPDIENTAGVLVAEGASNVFLSGSGPSVVGIFDSALRRSSAQEVLANRRGIDCFPVHSISKTSYFERLGLSPGQSFGF